MVRRQPHPGPGIAAAVDRRRPRSIAQQARCHRRAVAGRTRRKRFWKFVSRWKSRRSRWRCRTGPMRCSTNSKRCSLKPKPANRSTAGATSIAISTKGCTRPVPGPRLLNLIAGLNANVERYIRLLVSQSDYRLQAQREHRAILASARVRNAASLAALVEHHALETAVQLRQFRCCGIRKTNCGPRRRGHCADRPDR